MCFEERPSTGISLTFFSKVDWGLCFRRQTTQVKGHFHHDHIKGVSSQEDPSLWVLTRSPADQEELFAILPSGSLTPPPIKILLSAKPLILAVTTAHASWPNGVGQRRERPLGISLHTRARFLATWRSASPVYRGGSERGSDEPQVTQCERQLQSLNPPTYFPPTSPRHP